MIKYWQQNSSQMMQLTIQHAQMVLTSLLIAFLLAIVLIAIFLRKKKLAEWVNLFFLIALFGSKLCFLCTVDSRYWTWRNNSDHCTGLFIANTSYLEILLLEFEK